jgi:hypothetical protein
MSRPSDVGQAVAALRLWDPAGERHRPVAMQPALLIEKACGRILK